MKTVKDARFSGFSLFSFFLPRWKKDEAIKNWLIFRNETAASKRRIGP